MLSKTTRVFWRHFDDLPADVKDLAEKAYRQFRSDPNHPSLQFKRVSRSEPVYAARIGIRYRALGLLEDDTITWFWIGSHDEYERLLGG